MLTTHLDFPSPPGLFNRREHPTPSQPRALMFASHFPKKVTNFGLGHIFGSGVMVDCVFVKLSSTEPTLDFSVEPLVFLPCSALLTTTAPDHPSFAPSARSTPWFEEYRIEDASPEDQAAASHTTLLPLHLHQSLQTAARNTLVAEYARG